MSASQVGDRLCVVCERRELAADEPQTCIWCLGRARGNLIALVDAYALLPAELVDRGGVSFEPIPVGGSRETPIPGGEALVLLAGGSLSGEALPGDPVPPLPVLIAWAAAWGARPALRNLADVTGYLDRRLGWAAQNREDFPAFCSDVRALRARVEAVTRSREPIDYGARIPCPECTEPLVRYYADPKRCRHGDLPCGCDQGGRRDSWHCPNRACGRVVTNREYNFAIWASLESQP